MIHSTFNGIRRCLVRFTLAATVAAPLLRAAPVIEKPVINAPVTITDNGSSYVLDNGIVQATITKANGNLPKLMYHGISCQVGRENWETTPSGQVTPSITIDPAKNGGLRGEVSVKGTGGRGIDIEVRYTLERGVSGFYTYAIYTHPAGNAAGGYGENRFINQLNSTFDWLSVDQDRNMKMISGPDQRSEVVIHAKEQGILGVGIYKNSVEHKYSYCAEMYKLPAYGWSSTKDHIGIWYINPSNEYLGGGPTRIDLVCHMGATMLDYWTSGHYAGGAECNVPAGEEWHKVVGPLFVYCNALSDAETPSQADLDKLAATAGNPTIPKAWTDNANALFNDALQQAKVTKAQWPYNWVQSEYYTQKSGRATVTGQLLLNDPLAPPTASKTLPHLWVGLTHPDYHGPNSAFAQRAGNGDVVTWDHDANYYQFWNEGTEDGKFTLPNVLPGNYTLHAIADGVLGEFAQADITVTAGKEINLGQLKWTPVRYGQQVWDIGFPDRTGGKFFKGDGANYWKWGWGLRYSLLFPNDITYTVGKSDYHKDWFFEQVPHSTNTDWLNPEAKDPANQPFGWVKSLPVGSPDPWRAWGAGRATTWTIKFNMDKSPQGYAALRVALAGADGVQQLAVTVNGKSVGAIGGGGGNNLTGVNSPIVSTNALRYNTDKAMWQQRTLTFDAAVLKPGENTMTLTVPAGDTTTGVVYDYLRLELNESYKLDGTPITPSKT
jgi:rhamnogalacturonan endolyase